MKKILIAGGGDLGREIHGWFAQQWPSFGGFLDDAPRRSVVGSITGFEPSPDVELVLAIAHPRTKLAVAEMLLARGASFLTLVHPSAILSSNVQLGTGAILCPNVVVSCDVTVGDFTLLNIAASVGHDAVIGRGCTINSHADIMGHARLGDGVFLGGHSSILPKANVGELAHVAAGSVVMRRVRPGATVMGVPARPMIASADLKRKE